MNIIRLLYVLAISIVLLGCATTDSVRIDNIPMYGQPDIPRPELLRKADEDFIQQAVSAFGSREKASQAWWMQAEEYMNDSNFDFAMRRYNQSWLLNPQNYQPYWGFGRVMIEQGKIDEAIEYLKKAKELIDDPYQKVALLADMGSAYTVKAGSIAADNSENKSIYFNLANESFTESIQLDPSYPDSWRRWAFSLYEQGDYNGAWTKVSKARELKARPFPNKFITKLEQKMPAPKQQEN